MKDKEILYWVKNIFGVKLKTAEDVYNFLANYCTYKFYYNSVYTQDQVLYRIKHRVGLNCADFNKHFVAPLLRALGYIVKFFHGKVTCNDNQVYGHYYLKITGRRFEDKIFDVVAATKTGRPFGMLCCIKKAVVGEKQINKIP